MFVFLFECVYVCVYLCLCLCVYARVSLCVSVCVCVHVFGCVIVRNRFICAQSLFNFNSYIFQFDHFLRLYVFKLCSSVCLYFIFSIKD